MALIFMKQKKLKELFESYFEPLCNYIVNKVGDIDKARDIVTDAFRYLYHEAKGIENMPMEKLVELVLTKTLEGCIVHFQEKDDKYESSDKTPNNIQNFERSVEEIMIEKELHDLMNKVNPNFTEKEKVAFNLFFSGVETKIAAEIMGISRSTYRTHKSIAIKKIRNALFKSGWGFSA
ncbi:hypothetical protein A4R26_11505 [Niastella populi]|uniref:HTH luxR-type domain-containing protein n=2 Tax=Niastella populi TaxID=550983 RepID=A0A1V9GAU3_9BACT|nr:hypothetical protein A4R26_11505 [Niastella populi]